MSKAYYIVISGVLSLLIVMGVGRFAYTVLVAGMIEGGLSEADAGLIASFNYAGYLGGALAMIAVKSVVFRYRLFVFMLAVSILTTLAMGLSSAVFDWSVIRLISGAASGMCFVLCSGIVFDSLGLMGKTNLSILLYSGVGIGIFFSGVFAPPIEAVYGFSTAWILIAAACVPLAAFAVYHLGYLKEPIAKAKASTDSIHGLNIDYIKLLIAYFLEGFGYIIYATFVVVLIKKTTNSAFSSNISWVTTGIAAAISMPLWRMLAMRIGYKKSLIAAFAVQAAGVLIPAVLSDLFSLIISGVLFGGTFMGITAISLSYAVEIKKISSAAVVAIMTSVYSIGQIIGPLVAGISAEKTGGFELSFILSSVCLTIGMVIVATLKK